MTESSNIEAQAPIVPPLPRLLAVLEWDKGARAALRRADPSSPPSEFYRILTPALDIAESAERDLSREELERRWTAVACIVARTYEFLQKAPLGQAMGNAGIAELRLLRLLQAGGDDLFQALRAVAHQLASKGQAFAAKDVERLILSDGRDGADEVRRRIARDYYRATESA